MLKRKIIGPVIVLVVLTFGFSRCFNSSGSDDPRGGGYAGSRSCMSCHKNIYSSSLHTAHFIAALPADSNTIQGSFVNGSNVLSFNPTMKVVMDKRDSGFYQTSYMNGRPGQTERFDISFGGVKGQTYAYWYGNEIFQLPISYVTDRRTWINSPGYDSNSISFERPIGMKCFNCHASYIQHAAPDMPAYYRNPEGFEKNSIVYSVDCERCHGPAADHVKFHTNNPGEKKARYIVIFSSLNREQKISMCAVCHSGAGSHMIKPAFDFKPGDSASRYIIPVAQTDYNHIDVHGNQRGLLAGSQCFIKSNMDCSSCHDTHVNDRGNTALYTNRCMVCHNNDNHTTCKMSGSISQDVLKTYCIACHMPALPSRLIVVGDSGALIHTHHIAIYPDQTRKIMAYVKSGSNATTQKPANN